MEVSGSVHTHSTMTDGGEIRMKKSVGFMEYKRVTNGEIEPLERLFAEGQLQAYKHNGFWKGMDTVRDKNIKQRALGRGLCSIGDLSKFLNGTKRMDSLLMTALLQRIGKSASNFSVLLTEEEYIYFDWRHQMCLAQLGRDWKRMEQLLEENAEIYRSFNETLQRQYVLLIRAILEEKRYHNRAQAEKLLFEAIRMTIPGFAGTLPDDTLLCRQELYAILLWQKLQPDEACSARLLE